MSKRGSTAAGRVEVAICVAEYGDEHERAPAVALNAVGGAAVGLMAGLLGGWLPALALFAIIGHRENAKRAETVVVDEFITYWEQRTDAMHALASQARPAHGPRLAGDLPAPA